MLRLSTVSREALRTQYSSAYESIMPVAPTRAAEYSVRMRA